MYTTASKSGFLTYKSSINRKLFLVWANPLIRPGDVIVDSVSCLLVIDPLANENAGGRLGQLTGAQHAVTVPLPITETALVHLATGIPWENPQRHEYTDSETSLCSCAEQGTKTRQNAVKRWCITPVPILLTWESLPSQTWWLKTEKDWLLPLHVWLGITYCYCYATPDLRNSVHTVYIHVTCPMLLSALLRSQ